MGIDIAERHTFSHLDQASIRRAAARWLRPHERAWCAAQPSFREALVVVLSCREAMYKAWGVSGQAHQTRVLMHGRWGSGWAERAGLHTPTVVASYLVSGASILTVAVAAPAGYARHMLDRIIETLA
ncbi:MAG: 4'-phosphopantetheinyl transferase superfamily protein [Gemmatimonadales bacterium]|nr:4'-phosphopantetheinyl transferase superfamily protein [Gemmatimonadales bacterium]